MVFDLNHDTRIVRDKVNGADLAAIEQRINRKISEIVAVINKLDLDADVFLSGSLSNGLFRGAKPASNSFNADGVPKKFDRLVEADIKIVLEEGIDPEEDPAIDKIRLALGATQKETPRPFGVLNDRTGGDDKATLLYCYEDFVGSVGLEFEICINSAPFIEIGSNTPAVISPGELHWGGAVLAEMRKSNLDYGIIFEQKRRQMFEAAWRMIGVFNALNVDFSGCGVQIDCQTLNEMPELFKSGIHPAVTEISRKWLEGVTEYERFGLYRPDRLSETTACFLAEQRSVLLRPPAAPEWVGQIERLYGVRSFARCNDLRAFRFNEAIL